MKKSLVVYGSTTGTCESIAQTIASKLGIEAIEVSSLTADVVAQNEALILGTSTWGAGELQDDWYDGVETLKACDMSGKTVAIFGCGDGSSYSDTFCDGIGIIYNAVKATGAEVVGAVSTDGYEFDESVAVVDNQFVGLAIDNDNQEDKTEERIDSWIAAITPSL